MGNKRSFTPTKKRIRNLNQYKSMTDDEFNIEYEKLYGTEDWEEETASLESRVDEKINALGNDYDFDDMKVNDMTQLRSLAMAMIQLDDLEVDAYEIRQNVDKDNIFLLEKVNKIISDLRSDVSSISSDLQLTKRVRAQSKDISIANKWKELSNKATMFYKKKMLYIFCTNCRFLLATVWLLYSESELNTIKLECKHCGKQFTVQLNELYMTGNRNLEDVVI